MTYIESPSYFAIIPASVRYDKNLCANAKLLYGEITALCHKEGYCWASNRYFANLYDVDERTIKRWIANLEENGYIESETQNIGFKTHRKIKLKDFLRSDKNVPTEGDKNVPTLGQKCHPHNKDEKDKKNKNNNKAAAPKPVVVVDSQAKGKELELLKQRLLKANAVLKLTPSAMEEIPKIYRLYELLYALEEFNSIAASSKPKNPAGAFISTLKKAKLSLDSMSLNQREMHLTSLGYVFVLDDNGSYWVKCNLMK